MIWPYSLFSIITIATRPNGGMSDVRVGVGDAEAAGPGLFGLLHPASAKEAARNAAAICFPRLAGALDTDGGALAGAGTMRHTGLHETSWMGSRLWADRREVRKAG